MILIKKGEGTTDMLKTEMRNEKTMHIDRMSALEIAKVMNEENMNAVRAVEKELDSVAEGIEAITKAFSNGGRLFYVGAGTSGRLGVLDASECPPTFGVPESMVVGIMAGGQEALSRAGEGEEDSAEAGKADIEKYDLKQEDVVVGISASGGAAYVNSALEYAKSLGCIIIGITSNAGSLLDKMADISICPDTGAEVVTGSTRLKAGTAQKLILNMLSTGAMIKSGYVYENLMINLEPGNSKLRQRMVRITSDILNVSYKDAEQRLEQSGWSIKKAIEM